MEHRGAFEAGDARRLAGDWFRRARRSPHAARWESTFLDASQVAVLARLVLGPASLLTRIPLPDADGFARHAGTGVPAAPRVHLWATTLFGVHVRVQPVGYRPGPRSHERLTEARCLNPSSG